MIIERQEDVTEAALQVMERTSDPRLREIMVSLVKHLHGFVREVRLTEDEFRAATAILNEIGQLSNDSHNEMVVMAGSLGISSLVCLLNNGDSGATETSQNLLGPFWRMHSPPADNGGSILRSNLPGPAMFVDFRFQDTAGKPVAGAQVDVWHCSPAGLYENQDSGQVDMNLRGKFTSDEDGRVWFRSVRPAGYPVPTHGVVGRLLAAQNRHPFRPAHVHALAFKEGFKTLITQVYADDDPNIESDAQFGVTRNLVGTFLRHDELHPTAPEVEAPWYTLKHNFTMERGEARLPKPPIK